MTPKQKLAFLLLTILILPVFLCGQSVDELIDRADEYHRNHEPKQALEVLQKASVATGNNVDVLWRIARAYYDQASLDDAEDRESLYLQSEEYARKAVEADPQSAEAHVWVATAVGKVALERGGKQKVELSREVKEEAESAIDLDPTHDVAYHILGRWHYEVSTLSWVLKTAAKIVYGGLPEASLEESIRFMERAVELAPDNLNHHLQLGKSYLEADRPEDAREEFRQVLQLPVIEIDDPEYKQEARNLLENT